MRLFVTRHGETIWNQKRWVCGISESELTEEGIQQADKLARILKEAQGINKIRNIYVSPLKRARDTSAPIEQALQIRAKVENDLHEVDFGIYEGADWYDEAYQKAKYEPFAAFPGGESIAKACHRIYGVLERIILAEKENTLLVCHGTVMRIIDTYFNSKSMDEYKLDHPTNCEIREYDIR